MARPGALALPGGWHAAPPATEAEIEQLRRAAPALPSTYLAFLRVSNGGEGTVNGRYVSLWPAHEVANLNEAYGLTRYLPRALAIGTDGGDYAYLLDGRGGAPNPQVLEIELGSLALAFDAAEIVAVSFDGLMGLTPTDAP